MILYAYAWNGQRLSDWFVELQPPYPSFKLYVRYEQKADIGLMSEWHFLNRDVNSVKKQEEKLRWR